MAKLKSGWLEQHIASAEHDFRTWPRWMLDAAGIMDVEQTETERLAAAVVEKDVEIERLREMVEEVVTAEDLLEFSPYLESVVVDRWHDAIRALAAALPDGAKEPK